MVPWDFEYIFLNKIWNDVFGQLLYDQQPQYRVYVCIRIVFTVMTFTNIMFNGF